jgi:transcriptional regulator with XRE-family HTH domain
MPDPMSFGFAGHAGRPRPLLRTMLGDVLRRERLSQERTLADVARAAKVSMPYLSEVERGRKEASSEVLAAICDALTIDLSDVLAEVRLDLAGVRERRSRRGTFTRLRSVPDHADQAASQPDGTAAGSAPAQARCLLAA